MFNFIFSFVLFLLRSNYCAFEFEMCISNIDKALATFVVSLLILNFLENSHLFTNLIRDFINPILEMSERNHDNAFNNHKKLIPFSLLYLIDLLLVS